jgi:hypothetical protein
MADNFDVEWKPTTPISIVYNKTMKPTPQCSSTYKHSTPMEDCGNSFLSKSWSHWELDQKQRYGKWLTPLRERRNYGHLTPIRTDFDAKINFDFTAHNVVQVPESRNVTRLVLRKKEDTSDCIVVGAIHK